MNDSKFESLLPAPALARTDLALVALLTLLAAALRIPGLNEGLWVDEVNTLLDYALAPVGEIVSSYESRNNHILYSLLAHFAVGQFGASAWAVRLPALVLGVLSVPAAYYLGRQLASRNEALLATAFLALSYHHVWFSQNARGYSGLLLGCVLMSICFIRLVASKSPGRGMVIAYGLIAAFTSWIHLAGAAMVLAHGLIWLAVAIPRPGPQKHDFHGKVLFGLVLAGLFSLVLYLPSFKPVVVEIVVDRIEGVGPPAWRSPEWVLGEFLTGATRAVPGGWPLAVMAALALALGIGSYVKQGLAPAAILILPVAITVLVVAGLTAIFFPRFLFSYLVFFILLAVRGGFVLCRTALPKLDDRHFLAAGLAVALSTALMVPGAWKPKQDFSAAAAFINAHRALGDAVVCFYGVAGPLRDYIGLDCHKVMKLEQLIGWENAHSRTWFIYTFPTLVESRFPRIWSKVQNEYTIMTQFDGTVGEGEIVIMLKSGNAAR